MLSKLMKYEIVRKKNILLSSLAIFVLTELLLLFCLFKGGNWLVLFAVVAVFLFEGVYLFVLYDNIKLLSDDLNSRSGYMLFLTPNHGYNIVGSKMIVGFIELIISTILIILVIWFNYTYANYLFQNEVATLIYNGFDSIKDSLSSMGFGFWYYVSIILGFVLQWFFFITTVYLALILRKTLFSTVRFKGFLSLAMFVVLNIITNVIIQVVSFLAMILTGYGDLFTGAQEIPPERVLPFVNLMVTLSNGLNLIFIVLFF